MKKTLFFLALVLPFFLFSQTKKEIPSLSIKKATGKIVLDGELNEEDWAAADVAKGRKVSQGVRALVVPGSQQVKKQAEQEGLDKVFIEAGFEWRDAGCSMCLSMNNDVVPAGEHCASTSNRNFEGRQGTGARTHLVSPEMAANAAIYGKFVDVRKVQQQN